MAAPFVGQHTREILNEVLGYDQLRLEQLAGAGVFGGDDGRQKPSEVRS
jgi:hypothetical protein